MTRAALGRLLPWFVPAVTAFAVLHLCGTPDRQIALYAVYFSAAIVLPGTLVFRALFGSRGNWPEDLGLGAATGLLVMLVGWALAAATGGQDLLIGWPILIVLIFVLVPPLRRHWRISEPDPLPITWSWVLAAVLTMVALWGASVLKNYPLPPATGVIYQDLYYHLALVHEMTRSMPFQVPQLAGDALRYHYLSDADIATASMITGIPPANLLLRLWILPVTATAVMTFAAVGRTAAGRWQAGALAAALGFAGHTLTMGSDASPVLGGLPISAVSPSQTYAMPLIGLFTLAALEALRGRSLRWAWALLPVLALVCAGAKSSVLPPLAAGVGLAGLVLFWRLRRIPWPAVGLLGVIVFGILLGQRLFAGGGASTLVLQPLQAMRWMKPYSTTLGRNDGLGLNNGLGRNNGLGLDGLLLPGMSGATVTGWLFIVGLLAWWALMQAPRLIGLVLPPAGPGAIVDRTDPGRWLLGGIVVAGAGGLWTFGHPSLSQGYFFTGVIPVAAVLTAWALTDRVRNWWIALAGAMAGAVWQLLAPEFGPPARPTPAGWAWALAAPVLTTVAVIVVAMLIAVAIWRSRAVRALPVLLIAAVAGGSIASGGHQIGQSLATDQPKPAAITPTTITAAEMRAALWLDRHAGAEDVVATNVHCSPIRTQDRCDARGFWVTGLGGQRALVESWGYADESVAAHGQDGLSYTRQPAPDPVLFELNERVFREGDPADVARLRNEYGVRWLFADSRAGIVSPNLAQVAQLRHSSGPVTVYELRSG